MRENGTRMCLEAKVPQVLNQERPGFSCRDWVEPILSPERLITDKDRHSPNTRRRKDNRKEFGFLP